MFLYIGEWAMWFVPAEKKWMSSSLGQSSPEGGMAESVTRIVASLNISLGISSTPFHGVSVKRKLLNVISIFGCFFLILLRASTGSLKGRMTSRCSALGPPPMAMVEASEASNRRSCPIGQLMSQSQILSVELYGTLDHWVNV